MSVAYSTLTTDNLLPLHLSRLTLELRLLSLELLLVLQLILLLFALRLGLSLQFLNYWLLTFYRSSRCYSVVVINRIYSFLTLTFYGSLGFYGLSHSCFLLFPMLT